MLAIARAFMSRPRLILLDEPSLGLAPLVTNEVFDRLRDITNETGVAVLLVEQNANLALDFAARAYVLEAGRDRGVGRRPADLQHDETDPEGLPGTVTWMTDFLQVLAVGIGDGAIYAMLGLGLVVIFRTTGLLNFAAGELAMFSTFIVWTIWDLGRAPVAGDAGRHGGRLPDRGAVAGRWPSDRSAIPTSARSRS